MEYLSILFSFLIVALLGLFLGLMLAIVSKFLAVKKDEKATKIEAILPNANCGSCGLAGCAAYAEALATSDISLTLCVPGGNKVAAAIGEILGKSVSQDATVKKAFVHCRGNRNVAEVAHNYSGLKDCSAINMFYGGDKVCKSGCLGGGSCIEVCPVKAIFKDKNGSVIVNRDLCISCAKCVSVCPTNVIKMIDENADVAVACNSYEKGPVVKKMCKVGCLGCTLCEKKSPNSGFKIVDNLAIIDYNIKGDRKQAMLSCPSKSIVKIKL